MTSLTAKQTKVMDFINHYRNDFGSMPTLQKIANHLEVKSLSTVHQHMRALMERGYLAQSDNYGSIDIVSNEADRDLVPIIGFIAAGLPIDVQEEPIDTIRIDRLPKSGEFYALLVRGDSMIDDGIYDGDTVVIKKQSYADNGQTVVAIIDEEKATLKKLYKEGKRFRLQPANQKLLPLFRDEVEVRGIVWQVIRSYNNRKATKSQKKYKTLDLFAGIGGIRKGFENTGFFETVFSNDFEKACAKTFNLNFERSKLVVEDITKINEKDLPDFEFLLGGFPCQAFSVAGYRKGFDDERGRGNLFFDIVRIIDEKKPEGFLLENVKNLKNHDGGKTFKVIEKTLNSLGYKIKSRVLNTMEYGNIPQNRERVYIVGFKDHSKTDRFEFPKPIKLTKKINHILEKKVEEKYYYNGKPLYEKLKASVKQKDKVYQWRRKYVRENKKGVSPTLTANMGMGGHNVPIIFDGTGIRKLTPRECARLQGYPDSYKFPADLADSALYKQIGNSVSVPVIERIAKQVKAVL